jgi:hypothetical protein
MNPARALRSAIVLKPSTLLHLYHVLEKRKYRLLFSRKRRRQPVSSPHALEEGYGEPHFFERKAGRWSECL